MARRKASERREPKFDVGADPPSKRRASSKPKRTAGGRGFTPRRLGYWTLVFCLWAVIACGGGLIWVGVHLPPIQSLEVPQRPPSVRIVGVDGRLLATRGQMAGADVSIKDLPPYLPNAFIAIEDRRFWSHYGVDPLGLARAAIANVVHRGVAQGGSTLTQQLAKNLFLAPDRTLTRKLQEAVLAISLERKYSKQQILEFYLNRVYFGAGAYGVEAAAQRYFNKSARQVTLAEAAMLAGLVKSPSRLSPIHNPDGAVKRGELVLAAMTDAGMIGEPQEKIALEHPARVIAQIGGGSVNYIADWIMDELDDLIGPVDQDVTVETSIDPALQGAAEKALLDELDSKGKKENVSQGSIVAMTPGGAVVAMIGGRDYNESQFNRAINAKRQPGSAFKPFVYLTALERGLTPESVREDKPIALKGWKPENYGRKYYGAVTLTQAIALSLNTVSVRLTLEFGPAAVAQTAYRLGIASKLDPNPSIALGTSEVSPLELVSAYAAFANGGYAVSAHVIERVRTAQGKVLYQRPREELGRIIEPRYVGMMNDMMRQTLLIGTARKAQLPGWPAAGKTGTSQDFRDAWFVGYTAHLVTGVWVGNDDSSPSKHATGGDVPVDIWSHVMQAAHRGIAPVELPGAGAAPVAVLMPSNSPPPVTPLSAPQFPLAPAVSPAPLAPGMLRPHPAVPVAAANVRPETAGPGRSGIDTWLMDRLAGRR